MNEQELCERLEGLGFSPGRLMRQASNETREAVSAVFSSGESNGDSSGARMVAVSNSAHSYS